mmetsp:Transcript_25343/g.66288  ORF Transcript_25343/g.66288 Transcript_25343/m.66288 type:complete len:214 (-) Transcript_25343:1019-1660(-)
METSIAATDLIWSQRRWNLSLLYTEELRCLALPRLFLSLLLCDSLESLFLLALGLNPSVSFSVLAICLLLRPSLFFGETEGIIRLPLLILKRLGLFPSLLRLGFAAGLRFVPLLFVLGSSIFPRLSNVVELLVHGLLSGLNGLEVLLALLLNRSQLLLRSLFLIFAPLLCRRRQGLELFQAGLCKVLAAHNDLVLPRHLGELHLGGRHLAQLL